MTTAPKTPLDKYLDTVNRLAAERRKKAEDKKLADPKRRFWWLDETANMN